MTCLALAGKVLQVSGKPLPVPTPRPRPVVPDERRPAAAAPSDVRAGWAKKWRRVMLSLNSFERVHVDLLNDRLPVCWTIVLLHFRGGRYSGDEIPS